MKKHFPIYEVMTFINDGIMQDAFNSNLRELMIFCGIKRVDIVAHNEVTENHDMDELRDAIDGLDIFDIDFKNR